VEAAEDQVAEEERMVSMRRAMAGPDSSEEVERSREAQGFPRPAAARSRPSGSGPALGSQCLCREDLDIVADSEEGSGDSRHMDDLRRGLGSDPAAIAVVVAVVAVAVGHRMQVVGNEKEAHSWP
jgi:hypothetical protein